MSPARSVTGPAAAWAELAQPPTDPTLRDPWRRRLLQWRQDAHRSVAYDGARYRSAELAWTRSCFVCGMVMLWDEALRQPNGENLSAFDFLGEAGSRLEALTLSCCGTLIHASVSTTATSSTSIANCQGI